jgi:neuron navigator 2
VKQSSKYDLPACLALDTLIPLPILSRWIFIHFFKSGSNVQISLLFFDRYVSLLNEHGRVILSGPSGTGKSYLARKLADYCIGKDDVPSTSTTVLK